MHKAEHVVTVNNGTRYEVCACGATRVNNGAWHTCSRCTHLKYHERA